MEPNLETLRPKLSDEDYWKLKLLIHTHDSFKAEAQPGVPISDPRSHASLARTFLATYSRERIDGNRYPAKRVSLAE